jgi:hypothetical protein
MFARLIFNFGFSFCFDNSTKQIVPNKIDRRIFKKKIYHHHHHHISVMELGHLLTRSGLTYPEVSSKVCHDFFCQLGNSVSLPWVIYYGAFYLHVFIDYLKSFALTSAISN